MKAVVEVHKSAVRDSAAIETNMKSVTGSQRGE